MSTDLGRVMPVLKGEYDATVAYTRLDIVTNSGSSYVCLVDNTGQPVTDTTYWQALAIKGETGNTGDTGPAGADGKDGAAATIAVGTVTTGAAGTSAAVTNAGTANAAKLNFTIPQGAKGDKGDPGTMSNVTIDGRNYFLNSRLYTGQNMGSQDVTITYDDFDVNTKMMHLTAAQSASTNAGVYINDGQLSEHSQNGDHWVFSADMRGTGTLRTIWREHSTSVTESNLTLTDAWQRVSQMGTTVDSTKGSWCIYFDTTKGAVDAYIKLIKVERNATVASGWTPAPEDPIQIVDGRTTNSIPSWYIAHYPRQSVTEIKNWSVMGIKATDFPTGAAPSNQYCTVRTDVPWIDNSAGWPYQTIEISGEALPVIFVRVGTSDSTWSAVKPITFW